MSRDGTPIAGDLLGWVPAGQRLTDTLLRAEQFALEQSHRQLTLEHLILALTDDSDAARVLEANGVQVVQLRDFVARYLSTVDDRVPPGITGEQPPVAAVDLKRIFDVASAAAETSARRQIDGALIVAAVIGEGKSHAASMLRQHGLNIDADDSTERPSMKPVDHASVSAPGLSSSSTEEAHRLLSEEATRSIGGGVGGFGGHMPTPAPQPEQAPGPVQQPPLARDLPPIQRTRRKFPESQSPSTSARPTSAPQPVAPSTDPPFARDPDLPEFPGSEARSEAIPAVATRPVQMDENSLKDILPAKMKLGTCEIVEIRILNSDIEQLTGQFEGRDVAHAGARLVSRSLCLRLRSPSRSFLIEPRSPEVQWIDAVGQADDDDATSWRWYVTAQRKGQAKLQLAASARTVTSEGTVLETALPEQTASVKVIQPVVGLFIRVMAWMALFGTGCVLGLLARPIFRLFEGFLA